ncbi:MAG TPA: phosphate acyltransferase PlsX [Myxococcota bacterium]
MTVTSSAPLALDAMGGDCGVAPLIEGALGAIDDGASVVVVGRQPELEAALDVAATARWRSLLDSGRLRLVDAPDVVTMDDKPAEALRKKKQSSMRIACDLVKNGEASGVVSTGNSGAMLATALFTLGRIEGVARPAIATVLPSFAPCGLTLLVDAGANIDCEPLFLAQWGVLGAVYMQNAFGQQRPVVGVLSNGEEDHKGTPLVREALALLRQTDANVMGFCEGRDINAGEVHVVVTDGFTGNLVLKTAEGVFSFMTKTIKQTFEQGTPLDMLGGLLSKPGYARMRRTLDPREFGAAPLLGLSRPAFIAHGKSDAVAVRAGLRALRRFVDKDVTEQLVAALARNPAVAWHRAPSST